MLQFGEILSLILYGVTVSYLLANRRRLWACESLRPFFLPFLFLLLAAIATVVEGLFVTAPEVLVLAQESVGLAAAGGWGSQVFNGLEHLAYAAAAVGLLAAVLKAVWTHRRAAA